MKNGVVHANEQEYSKRRLVRILLNMVKNVEFLVNKKNTAPILHYTENNITF